MNRLLVYGNINNNKVDPSSAHSFSLLQIVWFAGLSVVSYDTRYHTWYQVRFCFCLRACWHTRGALYFCFFSLIPFIIFAPFLCHSSSLTVSQIRSHEADSSSPSPLPSTCLRFYRGKIQLFNCTATLHYHLDVHGVFYIQIFPNILRTSALSSTGQYSSLQAALLVLVTIQQGSPPGSKCLGEWRKDTLFLLFSLPDAMTTFVCTSCKENLPGKMMNSHFTSTAVLLGRSQ